MVSCNVITPQLFWFKKIRTSPWIMFIVVIFVNIGMWFERFVITVTSLSRDFLPSSWGYYTATWVDYGMLIGSFGLFFFLFLLFMRFGPMVAMACPRPILTAPMVESTTAAKNWWTNSLRRKTKRWWPP
jgi:molybdopterin-containing oxidoreductase family membrane subunit